MSFISTLAYLNDNIGSVTDLGSVETTFMPLFLRGEYAFNRAEILGKSIVLAEQLSNEDVTIDRIKNRKTKIYEFIDKEDSLVFVFSDMSEYLRRRLIEEKISFIVLGKSIFILELGTVFSERTISKYTKKLNVKSGHMTPTVQALFLYLLRTQDFSSSMAEIASEISVSSMSVSRAFQELIRFGLIKSVDNDFLILNGSRIEVWQRAIPLMRNPVVKTVYIDPDGLTDSQRSYLILSGESALSRHSMLSAPSSEMYGIHKSDFMAKFKEVTLLPIREKNSLIVQLFRHKLFSADDCLDELSTALVLIDEADERVRGEVARMLEEYFDNEVTNG